MQTQSVNYDQVASEYAAHRQIHSGVFHELCEMGCLSSDSAVLEVGCGSGNYIRALTGRFGCTGYGLDPSAAMLAQARTRRATAAWVQARAERLGVCDAAFDLIFSVDVIHHVADKASFYHEAARALRPGGRICTVTDSADIIRRREILSGYFPETVQIELARYPRIAQLEAWMAAAALTEFQVTTAQESYEITNAQPFRDKAYSSLHLIPEPAWLGGLERLERDLARGPVRGTSRYACVWGRKPVRLIEGLDRAT
ncbi:MAG TPA: class I SAM-dependent methyltransferase [Anaerolineae bacterium]|nr:class I SAM-dependent methyltransferase [Anaerolineae bacterium]